MDGTMDTNGKLLVTTIFERTFDLCNRQPRLNECWFYSALRLTCLRDASVVKNDFVS
jgi:hypothetical protein